MFTRARTLVILVLALLVAPAVTTAQEATVPSPVTTETPAAPAPISPMMKDILAAWDAHAVVVAALEEQVAVCTDAAAALALQHQIEAARAQVEVQILTVQASYARREGRLEDAAAIEADIAALTAPPTRGVPVERPHETD